MLSSLLMTLAGIGNKVMYVGRVSKTELINVTLPPRDKY